MSGDDSMLMVTVSGPPGSGTSTLVSKISLSRGWNSMNGGDVFREEATRRGLTVEELSAKAKDDLDIDRRLDSMLQERMKSNNSPEIVESRLSGWWALKNNLECLRVWIAVSNDERARRIQTREGGSMTQSLQKSKQRQSDDKGRYLELYEIDLDDLSPYNLVIDADDKDEDEVFAIVDSKLGR
ncbi:MAG TPA: cytidylate kinase family protein [Candidatus Thalassarchaeaceae archaeon]|nr:cytidylate kinase family protein [Candidatus Thalassarchaeaceae archaeon]|tara:strand:- start:3707 stop:4258 length:552 start_codon:yes stop_codon:yes gene_type:complete